MKELELNAIVLSEFKGEINGYPVSNEDVYYSVRNILEYIEDNHIKLTKWSDFISDMIEAFKTLNANNLDGDFEYVYEKLLGICSGIETIDDLTDMLNNITEVEGYSEFDTVYDRIKNDYYIS